MASSALVGLVLEALRRAVTIVPSKTPITYSEETRLYGSGTLTSLALVWLVAILEQRIREHYGTDLTLVDDRVRSGEIRPFYSVATLADYVEALLDGSKSAPSEE